MRHCGLGRRTTRPTMTVPAAMAKPMKVWISNKSLASKPSSSPCSAWAFNRNGRRHILSSSSHIIQNNHQTRATDTHCVCSLFNAAAAAGQPWKRDRNFMKRERKRPILYVRLIFFSIYKPPTPKRGIFPGVYTTAAWVNQLFVCYALDTHSFFLLLSHELCAYFCLYFWCWTGSGILIERHVIQPCCCCSPLLLDRYTT